MPMPQKPAQTNAPKVKTQAFTPFDESEEASATGAEVVPVAEDVLIEVPSVPITYDYTPTSEDISMPRIQLLQGNAEYVLQGNAKAGDWMLPGGETVREFTIEVLGMRRSRIRAQKPPQGSNAKPVTRCLSPDAVQGYGDPGTKCAECPFAQWGDKNPTTGKGTPPECRLRYHYLVETNNGDRAELTLNTTTKASKQAANQLTEGIVRWGNGGNFHATITAKLQESNGNRYFVPLVTSVQPNAAEEDDEAPGFDEA